MHCNTARLLQPQEHTWYARHSYSIEELAGKVL